MKSIKFISILFGAVGFGLLWNYDWELVIGIWLVGLALKLDTLIDLEENKENR